MAKPPYDPLPLTGDDLSAIALYNTPPSPDPHLTSFHSASSNLTEHHPRFLGPALHEDLRHSFASSSNAPTGGSQYTSSLYALNDSGANPYRDDLPSGAVPMSPTSQPRFLEEKNMTYPPPPTKSHRRALLLVVLAALIIVIVAVIIPIYFTIIKPKTNPGSRAVSTSPTESASSSTPSQTVTGGAGSLITMEDGTTFTYNNQFGGYWYFDENDPFNNGARAQSWTPALNETFNYGIDKIRG
jgi:glucan 1,3-beta-glucosidase